ncbi:aldolase [Verticiella sediminum]|uniref:Aldolase n=1 Tax=Verticiella sediminum TaxID=1247510 RepID=A0A556B266_9BURK|nr:aldolase/citrate lyase family protein [Verticiella sediminum]TSH99250.1 aldolase [Verticiella sediminum]
MAMDADWLNLKARNSVVERLNDGQPVAALGIRCSRTPDIIRIAKATGHHAVWMDLEHSSMSLDTASVLCNAALDQQLVPFVRIPEREYGVIGRLLDGGAVGIIAPRIETVAQAEDLVQACKFPPMGSRSAIGSLPQLEMRRVDAASLNAAMNRLTVLNVLIETPLGIENMDAMAAVPGVDMISIGTNDLAAEMGVPGDFRHPRVRQAHEAAIAACRRRGKLLTIGGVPDPAYSAELIRMGAAPFLFTGIDTDILLGACQERLSAALSTLES